MRYWKKEMPEGRRFKKGERPWNWKPVGSERMTEYGIKVKVAEPDKWRPKQIVLWEEANGPLPKGWRVNFIDGDSGNFSLDNLKAAPRVIIGEEREGYDGHQLVRVSATKWRRKQFVVWEEANGPLPTGYTIIFLDGDILNCKLENLLMVPKSKKRWRLTDVYGHDMRPLIGEINSLKCTCKDFRAALHARLSNYNNK